MRRVAEQRGSAVAEPTLRVSAASAAGGPSILELEGEFDLDAVPEIDRFLRRNLGPLYHQDHLVIDLARTTFVDSSFIAFLVRLSASQRAHAARAAAGASRRPGAARAVSRGAPERGPGVRDR